MSGDIHFSATDMLKIFFAYMPLIITANELMDPDEVVV